MIIGVTGATGIIGKRVISRLKDWGNPIRILTRKEISMPGIDVITGDLCNQSALGKFLKGVNILFHCAGEINDESRMFCVNVEGTQNLLEVASKSGLQVLCQISSAGVIGLTNRSLVNEDTPCQPQNTYEKSKYLAEKQVMTGFPGCRVVVLRPTNVFDEEKPGFVYYALRNSFLDRFKKIIKGGESAHLIHAEDVAAAAIHSIKLAKEKPEVYFVSQDHDPINTISGIERLCRAIKSGADFSKIKKNPHLPPSLPFLLRWYFGRQSNRGDVRYSSEKLLSAGFIFPVGLREGVKRVVKKKMACL